MDAPIEEHVILQMPSEETARRLVDCLADGDPSQTLKLTFLGKLMNELCIAERF